MNIVHRRELVQYGFCSNKNYDFAIKTLKSLRGDEYRSLMLPEAPVGGEPPVFACRFSRVPGYENILALANEDGKIGIQDTTSMSKNKITCIEGHMNAIFDVAWSDTRLRLVSVSGDHTAMLWNITDSGISPLGMFEGHTRSVKVASFRPRDANVFATGARDGMIILWDYRCAQLNTASIRPDNVISNAHCQSGLVNKKLKRKDPSRAESITGLAFQDENFLISCSAGDGLIKVWDIRKCYMVHRRIPQPCFSLPHPGGSAKNGFTSLMVDPGTVRLYANCMDNNIYCFNISTYEKNPVATFTGHQNHTFYVKSCLSGDGQYLLSGSSDESAYIWNVRQPGAPLARLQGHSAEVTCVDWAENCDGEIKLVTCADDACHRLWRMRPATDKDEEQRQSSELVGWVEWVDRTAPSHCVTPQSMKRMIRRQERTPGNTEGTKYQKIDDSGTGQDRTVLASVQPKSQSKGSRRLFDADNSQCGIEVLSPTSNLPNYVIEGTSPHHRCSSATKQKENWLVKFQTTPSPKQIRKLTPKRRSQTPTTPKACGNLLKFFRVAAKQPPINMTPTPCEVLKDPQTSPVVI